MSVQIVLGSKADKPVADRAIEVFKELGIPYKLTIASAHRTPELVEKLVEESGAEIFIAIAGLSAALPGVIASRTLRPVIGVPVSGPVNLDAILSILQMPPGVPVAAVGLDRGENAALLAAEMLAIKNGKVAKALSAYRERLKHRIVQEAKELGS